MQSFFYHENDFLKQKENTRQSPVQYCAMRFKADKVYFAKILNYQKNGVKNFTQLILKINSFVKHLILKSLSACMFFFNQHNRFSFQRWS